MSHKSLYQLESGMWIDLDKLDAVDIESAHVHGEGIRFYLCVWVNGRQYRASSNSTYWSTQSVAATARDKLAAQIMKSPEPGYFISDLHPGLFKGITEAIASSGKDGMTVPQIIARLNDVGFNTPTFINNLINTFLTKLLHEGKLASINPGDGTAFRYAAIL